ncbi:hypothetical protein [Catenuloplanes japonicus]|uniref:hypothetical protein n=1 Tax=Catenuloplanes japonicus TaxID=33876 RepID=UPI00068C1CF6|nr:hypothetical protein [Catenuloplanes japonicus]
MTSSRSPAARGRSPRHRGHALLRMAGRNRTVLVAVAGVLLTIVAVRWLVPDQDLRRAAEWIRQNWLSATGVTILISVLTVIAPIYNDRRRMVADRRQAVLAEDRQRVVLLRRHCRVDDAGRLPTLAALSDPIMLGVHPAATISSPAPAPLDLPAAVPVYIPRDLDARLDAALAGGGLVLLVGDSTAGKSRAGYEAMRRLPGDRHLLVPYERDSLRQLLDEGLEFRDTIVWLDDLERFLGPGGLDTALLHRIVGDGTRRVVLLATMRASESTARFAGHDGKGHPGDRNLLRAERDLLDQATRLDLPRRFSRAECDRAQERDWDPRIAEALAHSGQYGLAEYIAAAPVLWRRWQDAQAVDNPDRLRVGAAIVAAALDCRRAGLRRPVPRTLVRMVADIYLDRRIVARVDEQLFDEGLAWAAETVQATSALLTLQADEIEVFDYLLDTLQAESADRPVPEPLWAHLVGSLNPADAWSVGIACYWAGRLEYAEQAFQCGLRAEERGIVAQAAVGLGELAFLLDQFEEARRWFGRAANVEATLGDAGVRRTALQQRQELVESERWYRHVAGVSPMVPQTGHWPGADEPAGHLVIGHEQVTLHYDGHRYRQVTRRELLNNSPEAIHRYPIRVAVDRFPDDPDRSRRHYGAHPLDVAHLRLRAWSDGREMDWEVKHDLPAFKEIWLLFSRGGESFALPPGGTGEILYEYEVSADQWGPWSQRPIRIPTMRLSLEFRFPEALRPSLTGAETSLVAVSAPLRVRRRTEDDQTIFSWHVEDPPLNARYRFEWTFNPNDSSIPGSDPISGGRSPGPA